MTIRQSTPDSVLVRVSALLHTAIVYAREEIERIPEDIDLDDEITAIDRASAKAYAIAGEIMSLDANSARARLVKRMASAWLDGQYPREGLLHEHRVLAHGAI